MKKLLIATTVAMTLSAAAHAADSTAQLKVQGVLTNDACTPTLTGGGTVDFGTFPVDTLSSTATNQLGKKDISLSISCTSPIKVAWGIEDNVGEPAQIDITNTGYNNATVYASGSNGLFGVGKTAGGVTIGAYSVALNRNGATADGVVSKIIYGAIGGATGWTTFYPTGSKDHVDNKNRYQYSLLDAEGDHPIAFTNAVFPMRVTLEVDKTSTLAITDETPILGQSTITLYYL